MYKGAFEDEMHKVMITCRSSSTAKSADDQGPMADNEAAPGTFSHLDKGVPVGCVIDIVKEGNEAKDAIVEPASLEVSLGRWGGGLCS